MYINYVRIHSFQTLLLGLNVYTYVAVNYLVCIEIRISRNICIACISVFQETVQNMIG